MRHLLLITFASVASFLTMTKTKETLAVVACVLLWTLLIAGVEAFQVHPRLAGRFSTRKPTPLGAAAVGIFFGTSTGSTEEAAEQIKNEFSEDDQVEGPFEIDGIQGSVADAFSKYDALIVGTPTWNTGADTERSGTGWDEIYYGEMQDLNLAGKKVAVFGLGDSVSYAENYADASGELHDVFESLGCKMIGYTSQEGYEHEDSKAIRGDLFCGLLLDAVNFEDLTEGRIKNWVAQLRQEGIFEGGGAGSAPAATVAEVVGATTVAETFAAPVTAVVGSSSNDDLVARLERENAELRKKLDENSNLLDESISRHSTDSSGFTPHFNHKTGRTMWTSPDGRSCYYTLSTGVNLDMMP